MIEAIDSLRWTIDPDMQSLCGLPYHGHPRGCPNLGCKAGCPPQPLLEQVLDFSRPMYVIWTDFDLGSHVARMHKRHPEWSDRQLYCCLYWQGTARKAHREEQVRARRLYEINRIVSTPEAHGVNVTALMALLNVHLEWPPMQLTRVVSLAGTAAHDAAAKAEKEQAHE